MGITPPGSLADPAEWLKFTGQISGIEFLMVVAAIWFGCNNVARDVVGEWTVYQRERMVSLRLPSYVFSKLAVAIVIVLFQCLLLLGIVTLLCHLQGSFLAHLGVLLISSMVGSAIGLCVSACATTTEAAIAMLPLILLPIITLGGGIRAVKDMPPAVQQLAKIVPSRWAFEANMIIEAQKEPHFTPPALGNASTPRPDIADNPFPAATRSSLGNSLAILGAMLVFWLSLALGFLRMRDIH